MVKLLLRFNADPNICDKVSIYREYKRILHVTRFRSSIYWIYNVMYVVIRSFYINLLFQYFVIKNYMIGITFQWVQLAIIVGILGRILVFTLACHVIYVNMFWCESGIVNITLYIYTITMRPQKRILILKTTGRCTIYYRCKPSTNLLLLSYLNVVIIVWLQKGSC